MNTNVFVKIIKEGYSGSVNIGRFGLITADKRGVDRPVDTIKSRVAEKTSTSRPIIINKQKAIAMIIQLLIIKITA